MAFTETESGAEAAEYFVGTNHVATGLPVKVSIESSSADGAISEADAEAIILDIYEIIGSDPRFQGSWATRARVAHDTWSPPAPPAQ